MAGGVVMSFMMKRTAKVGDLYVSALAGSSATADKQFFELRGMNAPSDASALLLEQSLEEFCVRNPLPKSSIDSGSFRLFVILPTLPRRSVALLNIVARTCIVELVQLWFMPLATKSMHMNVLQSCVLQAHLDFICPYYGSFPEAALGNLLALLVIMRGQEQRVEFFMAVGPMYQFPNMADSQREVYLIPYYNPKPLSLLTPP